MKKLSLSDNTELNWEYANASITAFNKPEENIERLYSLASRDSWQLSNMNWESIDLSGIPQEIRQQATNMFVQIQYGELSALIGAQRILERTKSTAVKNFLSTQINDETRHLKWFGKLIDKLGCRAPVLPSIKLLNRSIVECESVEALVVGLHIMIESMAHTFYTEGAKSFEDISASYNVFKSYRSAKIIATDWLPNFIAKDESRHIAFGVLFLKSYVSELSSKKKEKLEQDIEDWAKLYISAANDPKLLAIPGIKSVELRDKCTKDINNRLKLAGLESAVPTSNFDYT